MHKCDHNRTYDTFQDAEDSAKRGNMYDKVYIGRCEWCGRFVNTLKPQFKVEKRPKGGYNK